MRCRGSSPENLGWLFPSASPERVDDRSNYENDARGDFDDNFDDLEPRELILEMALDIGHIFLLAEGSLVSDCISQ